MIIKFSSLINEEDISGQIELRLIKSLKPLKQKGIRVKLHDVINKNEILKKNTFF